MKQIGLWLFVLLQVNTVFSQKHNAAENMLQRGITAYTKGNYSEALPLLQKSALMAKSSGDQKQLRMAYHNLGNTYSQIGETEKALYHYQLSENISRHLKDTLSLAKTIQNVGTLYEEQKDFPAAMRCYNEALKLGMHLRDKGFAADCLNNVGILLEQQNQYGEALSSYAHALEIYTARDDQPRIAMASNNLAILYKNLRNYPASILNYKAALSISIAQHDQFTIAATQNNLGNVYAMTGNYPKSLELCNQAYRLAKTIGAQEIVVESLDGIATAYEKSGRPVQALQYRKQYEREKETFINTDRSRQLAQLQVRYETEKKQGRIRLLQQQNKIKGLEISRQQLQIQRRNQYIAAIAFLFLALLITGYFYRSRQKLRNRIRLANAIRETEEQERLRMAKDIHDDLGSGLSKINFLSEIILKDTEHLPQLRASSESIKETARKMVENMRDLIWALNPENTTLANLVARLREYASDYLEDFPIEVHFDFPDNLPQTPIRKESHRQLFMAVKESLNNTAKHSGATRLFFKVLVTDKEMIFGLKDNGKGFDCGGSPPGNGLTNMKARLREIGGSATTISKEGKGCETSFSIPLEKIIKDNRS